MLNSNRKQKMIAVQAKNQSTQLDVARVWSVSLIRCPMNLNRTKSQAALRAASVRRTSSNLGSVGKRDSVTALAQRVVRLLAASRGMPIGVVRRVMNARITSIA